MTRFAAAGSRSVDRGELPAHVARRIISDAHSDGLVAGDTLTDESGLIERYGVSRGTLREALRLLSFLGAIKTRAGPGGGPRLMTPGPAVVGSALAMVVQFRGATLRTVFEARAAMEPAIASLAAQHRTQENLDALDQSLELLRATRGAPGYSFADESGQFHILTAEASHNPVLGTVVPALVAMTATVPWRYPKGGRSELTTWIGSLVEAIRQQDSAAAAAAYTHMFTWAITDLERNQVAAMETPVLWPHVDSMLSHDRSESDLAV